MRITRIADDIDNAVEVPWVVSQTGKLEVDHAKHNLFTGYPLTRRDRPSLGNGCKHLNRIAIFILTLIQDLGCMSENTGTDWLAFEGEAQPRSAQNLSTSTIAAQLAAIDVFNPYTGEKLCDIAEGGAEDINRAVAAARAAFPAWRDMFAEDHRSDPDVRARGHLS